MERGYTSKRNRGQSSFSFSSALKRRSKKAGDYEAEKETVVNRVRTLAYSVGCTLRRCIKIKKKQSEVEKHRETHGPSVCVISRKFKKTNSKQQPLCPVPSCPFAPRYLQN